MDQLSTSARVKLREFAARRRKDVFEVPDVLASLLEQSREASRAPYVLPAAVERDERVSVERLEASDGTVCYLLTPRTATDSNRMAVYFHGGGFVLQIGEEHWEPCIRMAVATGSPVLVPLYPLLPGAACREAYASALAAYDLACRRAVSDRIALLGDSAGGHLALGVAACAVAGGLSVPGVVVGVSPLIDFAGQIAVPPALDDSDPLLGSAGVARIGELWCDDAAKRAGFPPHLLAAPLAGFPPVRLFVGSREVLRPSIEAFASALSEAGSDVRLDVGEGLWHCYAIMLDVDEGRSAFARIIETLRTL